MKDGNQILKVGDKIKFVGDGVRYTVRAIDKKGRYAICVWKCNLPRLNYMYTIADFKEGVRGAHDRLFNCYENSDKAFRGMLTDLLRGKIEMSKRNFVDLEVERYFPLLVKAVNNC